MTKRQHKQPKKQQDRTLLISGVIVAVAVIAVALLVLNNNNSTPQSECGALVSQWREGGMTTTASGLQYKSLIEGTGPSPVATSSVTVNYRGCLLNGTQFDSSYDRGQPISFALNGVIPGWTEGVQLMPQGSRYLFYIPAELAYGAQGRPPTIPANSPLIFEIELLGFQ